ncbi:MAG: response regulator [Candidatus Saliniplasma sp.]
MKILLVDDEEEIRELSKTYLEDVYGNLTIDTADSARTALDLLNENYYSAVVSDYQMPEMNGLEFLDELRDRGDDIPFIIFTGRGREEVAMKALNLGADRYIQKGGDPRSQYVVLAQAIKQSVEHKNAQRELQRSEKEKTSILNSLSEVVNHQDEDGRIIWANRAFSEEVQKKTGDLTGEYCFDIWFGRDKRCKGCPIVEAYKTGEREEAIIPSKEGDMWYIRGEPIKGDNDEIIGMMEIAADMTEKRKAREELEKIEKKFSKLVESSSSAVFILKNTDILYLNRATELITGFSEDELKSMDFMELVSKEQKEVFNERVDSIQNRDRRRTRFELKIVGKNEEERWLYLTMTYLEYDGENTVMCTGVEITDQKYLEKALVSKSSFK